MLLGDLGNYQIRYLNCLQQLDWSARLPQKNWLLLVLVGDVDRLLFDQVTAECLKHRPLGICCAGPSAHLLEDWFDEAIVMVALAWEEKYQREYDYTFAPVTTADTDIDNGFWYAATLAPDIASEPVETILCLDFTGQYLNRITELIYLIANGWLPADELND